MNRKKEAVDYYATAEAIYYNKYHDKISNLDEVSLLYYKAIKTAYDLQDEYSVKKFTKRLIDKFGVSHKRTLLVLGEK